MPGTLFVVATPIGNLEDITLRALRVLREVSIIAAEDTRRTAHLLARHAITTPTTSLHHHNETRKSAAIVARLERGENVALVSDAGTPTISDPGQALIRDAIAAGIRVEAVPGPSAILTALSSSGIAGDGFKFRGFPPTRSKDRTAWFAEACSAPGILVFFEAPHRIRRTLEELQAVAGDCHIALGRELTKVHEELVRGPISTVIRSVAMPRGEYTVVAEIGHKPETPATDTLEMGASRRQAIAQLAEANGLTPNQLYKAIEHARKSVE
jgi:16S rRNA (cytidine1402-2'-O)-methyltransferase